MTLCSELFSLTLGISYHRIQMYNSSALVHTSLIAHILSLRLGKQYDDALNNLCLHCVLHCCFRTKIPVTKI